MILYGPQWFGIEKDLDKDEEEEEEEISYYGTEHSRLLISLSEVTLSKSFFLMPH